MDGFNLNMLLSRKTWKERPDVWVIEDKSFAYIQIPKVASRSIRACLAAQLMSDRGVCIDVDTINDEDISLVDNDFSFHCTHRKVKEISQQYFLTAFVRNPFERLYSCYQNKVVDPIKTGKRNIFKEYGLPLGASFSDFVHCFSAIPDNKTDRHVRSQFWFLSYQKKLLPQYIGKLENFSSDWSFIAKKFGFPEAKVRNASALNFSLEKVYNRELIDLVERRYEEDIYSLGYEDSLRNLRESVG